MRNSVIAKRRAPGALLLIAAGVAAAIDHAGTPARVGAPIDDAARPLRSCGPGGVDERSLRGPGLLPSDWFVRQRAYPFDAIPEPARRRAFADGAAFAALTRSAGAGAWTLVGPTNIGGRITDVAAHVQSPGTILAGTADGGIFRSLDGGATWSPIFDVAPSISIGALAIAPSDPLRIYAGTGEANAAGDTYSGDGVYVSTDGGDTWAHAGLDETAKIARIRVHPEDADHAYVAAMGRLYGTNPQRGVFRTTDGGASWDHVLSVDDSTGAVDIVMDPTDPDRLLAATWERIRRPHERRVGGPGSGVYRSLDGGDTWTLLGPANGLPAPTATSGRIGLTLCASDPLVAYAMYADHPGDFIGIYRTADGGASWSRVGDGPLATIFNGFGWYFGQIRVDPRDPDVVFAMGVLLYRSLDGGASWSINGFGVHVDHHAMWIDPGAASSRILLGNDGGVYESTDFGDSWTPRDGLPISQFYAITVDPQLPWRIYGGTQDNSTMRTPTGSLDDWEIIYGGDGFYTIVHPMNPAVIYAEFQFGGLGKSIDAGSSFSQATNGIPPSDRRNWSTPVVMDPSDPETLYYGTFRVFRTTNGASSWSSISPDLTNGPGGGNLSFGTVTTIAASPADPTRILAGTDDGNVWITTDDGGTWLDVSAPLPERWVTRVAFDSADPEVAYVTLSGYTVDEPLPHIFRTADSGATWMDVSSNLPGVPLNDVVVDPDDTDRLYVASDAGVYWSANAGGSWRVLGTGLPPVAVHDLHLHSPTRTLVAGTHGRSAYTFSLDAALSVLGVPASLQSRISAMPNPTRGMTTLSVDVPIEGRVIVEIFDASGRRVSRVDDRHRDRGRFRVRWDGRDGSGRDVAPGVYFHRVVSSAGPVVGRLVVTR